MTDAPLRDPDAVRTRLGGSELYPWYDSVWLTKFTKAKAILRAVKPSALPDFLDALRPLATRLDFEATRIPEVFDPSTLAEIRHVIATLRPTDMKMHEARTFGRFVVHDHPQLAGWHARTTELVSRLAGEPVEPSYSFLSLYTDLGVCPLHLDSPYAKWTLDLCVNQSTPWPIHFSPVQPWFEALAETDAEGRAWRREGWDDDLKHSSLAFATHTLEPGEAVLFSGSSQWHYRDALPPSATPPSCDLLFFHFVPRGTAERIEWINWARLFDVPELAEIS